MGAWRIAAVVHGLSRALNADVIGPPRKALELAIENRETERVDVVPRPAPFGVLLELDLQLNLPGSRRFPADGASIAGRRPSP